MALDAPFVATLVTWYEPFSPPDAFTSYDTFALPLRSVASESVVTTPAGSVTLKLTMASDDGVAPFRTVAVMIGLERPAWWVACKRPCPSWQLR